MFVHLVFCSYGFVILGIGCGHMGQRYVFADAGCGWSGPGIDAHYVPLKCAR